MKVIGYCRVSTDQQVDQGVSLEAQRGKIEAYCDLYNLELVEVILDGGYSAKSLNRPGIQRVLDMLKRKEAAGLIVYKLDRLTRSVVDMGSLVADYFDKGLSLVSVSEQIDTRTAGGRLVLNVFTSVSQWEREIIGERTRDAMGYKRGRGEFIGEAPFGFKLAEDGVHLQEDQEEQKAVASITTLKAEGLSLREIVARLNAEQVPARGARWHKTTVARILKKAA